MSSGERRLIGPTLTFLGGGADAGAAVVVLLLVADPRGRPGARRAGAPPLLSARRSSRQAVRIAAKTPEAKDCARAAHEGDAEALAASGPPIVHRLGT